MKSMIKGFLFLILSGFASLSVASQGIVPPAQTQSKNLIKSLFETIKHLNTALQYERGDSYMLRRQCYLYGDLIDQLLASNKEFIEKNNELRKEVCAQKRKPSRCDEMPSEPQQKLQKQNVQISADVGEGVAVYSRTVRVVDRAPKHVVKKRKQGVREN